MENPKTGGSKRLTYKSLDTKSFVNLFMGKYIQKEKPDCVIDILPNNSPKVLMVIDMQKDFIDKIELPSYYGNKGLDIGKGKQIGAFAVQDGKTCVEQIITYLNKHRDDFDKIIFTRDLHDPRHCSFSNEGGVFPNHCVIGTEGSKFDPDVQAWIDKNNSNKVEVLFKGMHPNQDSFGAIEYGDEHRKKRQLGNKCCGSSMMTNDLDQGSSCSDIFTGCKKLKGGFDSNQWKFGETYANISQQFEDWDIKDIIGNKDVYICGLAGDYCVRDTALNLADMRNTSVKNVYVLHDLTRNAFIPITDDYKKAKFDKANRYGGELVNPDYFLETEKSITDYVFDNSQLISRQDLNSIRLSKTPLSNKFHFVTDVRQIIADYCNAGVKLFTENPALIQDINIGKIPTQGGKRRRKTKKRHNKKTKRKVTKKRHHKKTKKRKVRKTKKNKTRKR